MFCINSVYRVSPFGEMLTSSFDVEAGILLNMPEWVQVDTKWGLDYRIASYSRTDVVMTDKKLKEALCRLPNCLAAINYEMVGFIAVYKDYAILYAWETFSPVHEVRLKKTITQEFKEIGVIKTKADTIEYRQLPAHISVTTIAGKEKVYTKSGLLEVGFKYDEVEEVDYSYYLSLMSMGNVYGYVMKNGKPVYLEIKNSKIIEKKIGD